MPKEPKESKETKKSKDKAQRASDKLSLDPLTFDEALAGLLATEPPAESTKQQKRSNTHPQSRAAAPVRKRKTKARENKPEAI
jgi:hypothetical protein